LGGTSCTCAGQKHQSQLKKALCNEQQSFLTGIKLCLNTSL